MTAGLRLPESHALLDRIVNGPPMSLAEVHALLADIEARLLAPTERERALEAALRTMAEQWHDAHHLRQGYTGDVIEWTTCSRAVCIINRAALAAQPDAPEADPYVALADSIQNGSPTLRKPDAPTVAVEHLACESQCLICKADPTEQMARDLAKATAHLDALVTSGLALFPGEMNVHDDFMDIDYDAIQEFSQHLALAAQPDAPEAAS